MVEKKITYSKDKVVKIKAIYSQAVTDLGKIKKVRNERMQNLMHKIDKKRVDKILQDIKNLD